MLSREAAPATQEQAAQKAKKKRAIDFMLENHKPPEERSALRQGVERVIDPPQTWWEVERETGGSMSSAR